jgi:hypothetical protein
MPRKKPGCMGVCDKSIYGAGTARGLIAIPMAATVRTKFRMRLYRSSAPIMVMTSSLVMMFLNCLWHSADAELNPGLASVISKFRSFLTNHLKN